MVWLISWFISWVFLEKRYHNLSPVIKRYNILISQKYNVLTLDPISIVVYSLHVPKNKNQKQLSDETTILPKVAAFASLLCQTAAVFPLLLWDVLQVSIRHSSRMGVGPICIYIEQYVYCRQNTMSSSGSQRISRKYHRPHTFCTLRDIVLLSRNS